MAENLASIVSPADELAEQWAARVRELDPEHGADEDAFLAVTSALVRHLVDGEPFVCPEAGGLSVGSLTALRQVIHERVGSRADTAVMAGMLSRVDEAIDSLLVESVEGRIRVLELDAFADPLTGAGNRRALERDLRILLAQVERYQHPLSIVMIDLNGLKAINDVDGHDAGDRLLRQLATTFTAELRGGDTFYRVGGDEFVAVLPHTDRLAADAFIERVRPLAPSFSAGIATAPLDAVAASELIGVADQRLIRHRRVGREARQSDIAQAGSPAVADHITVGSVSLTVDAESTTVEVLLRQGALARTGKATGPSVNASEPTLAAIAALDAFRRLGYDVGVAAIESTDVRTLAGRDVVTVMISSRAADMEILATGSSVARRSVAEAAAFAVVQALERRVPVRQIIQV